MIRLSDVEPSSRLLRLAAPAAVAYAAVFPVLQVGIVAEWPGGGHGKAGWALAATACFLPLHLRHVAHAVRGSRPPGGVWTLAAMAAIVVGVLPVIGSLWLQTFHVLAVSALIVLRPRWSLPVVAVLLVAQWPLALALGSEFPDAGSYFTFTLVWRTASVFVPAWLVGAIEQLQATRRALAEEAVVRERLRIDVELRRSLGTALDGIVARCDRASALVADEPRAADGELRALVDGSRRALIDARRLVTGYQRGSLRAELDTAATLLGAAGIDTRVVLPDGELPDTLGEGGRAALRSATAALLRDETATACAIVVTCDDGQVRLELRRDDVPLAEVTGR